MGEETLYDLRRMPALVLDDAAVRKVDRSGAVEHLKALPDQVSRGLRLGAAAGPLAVNRRVVVVGMGGSGIAGEVLGAWLAAEKGLALAAIHDSRLPPWVGESDLVAAVSYSGNTLETLAATREAMGRGCDLVGIASGGTLRDLCNGHGLPYLAIPPGLMPRSAFGYLFGALAGLFDASVATEVGTAAGLLKARGEKLVPLTPERKNAAKALAQSLKGRTPIVYGTPTYAPVARRWQSQFNENAKVLAWASVVPEADHNELVGWAEDPAAKKFAPIFLRDPAESESDKAMLDATRALITRTKVETVKASGETLLARMLTTIQLGDWTSFYLAILRKIDPTPVAVIGKLKERLAKG